MKKRRVTNPSGIKHRDIRRKAYKSYESYKSANKPRGDKWVWHDEEFYSGDLGF